ncbi:MAG: GxxExxY protein [Isosphaerales bacterium]
MNPKDEPDREYDVVAHAVIGAAIEVHRHLGPGYLESVYQNAMQVELTARSITFEQKKTVEVFYKGQPVGEGEIDLFVGGLLVVELKAVEALAPIHKAQIISYLKAMRRPLGLLINFKVPLLHQGVERVVLSQVNRQDPEWGKT